MPNNSKPTTPCEFVDIFPTLCELANIPMLAYQDGVSLVLAIKTKSGMEDKQYAKMKRT